METDHPDSFSKVIDCGPSSGFPLRPKAEPFEEEETGVCNCTLATCPFNNATPGSPDQVWRTIPDEAKDEPKERSSNVLNNAVPGLSDCLCSSSGSSFASSENSPPMSTKTNAPSSNVRPISYNDKNEGEAMVPTRPNKRDSPGKRRGNQQPTPPVSPSNKVTAPEKQKKLPTCSSSPSLKKKTIKTENDTVLVLGRQASGRALLKGVSPPSPSLTAGSPLPPPKPPIETPETLRDDPTIVELESRMLERKASGRLRQEKLGARAEALEKEAARVREQQAEEAAKQQEEERRLRAEEREKKLEIRRSESPSSYREDAAVAEVETRMLERKASGRLRQEKLDAKAKALEEAEAIRVKEEAEEAAKLREEEQRMRSEEIARTHELRLEGEVERRERVQILSLKADIDVLEERKSTTAKFDERREEAKREEEALRAAALRDRQKIIAASSGPAFYQQLKDHEKQSDARKQQDQETSVAHKKQKLEETERREREVVGKKAMALLAELWASAEQRANSHQQHQQAEANRKQRVQCLKIDVDVLEGKKSTAAKFEERREQAKREEEALRAAALEERHQQLHSGPSPGFGAKVPSPPSSPSPPLRVVEDEVRKERGERNMDRDHLEARHEESRLEFLNKERTTSPRPQCVTPTAESTPKELRAYRVVRQLSHSKTTTAHDDYDYRSREEHGGEPQQHRRGRRNSHSAPLSRPGHKNETACATARYPRRDEEVEPIVEPVVDPIRRERKELEAQLAECKAVVKMRQEKVAAFKAAQLEETDQSQSSNPKSNFNPTDDPVTQLLEAKLAERKVAEKIRQHKLAAKAQLAQEEADRLEQAQQKELMEKLEADKLAKEEEMAKRRQKRVDAEAARMERAKQLNVDMDILGGKKSALAKFDERRQGGTQEDEEARLAALEERHQRVIATTGKKFFDKIKESIQRSKCDERKRLEEVEVKLVSVAEHAKQGELERRRRAQTLIKTENQQQEDEERVGALKERRLVSTQSHPSLTTLRNAPSIGK